MLDEALELARRNVERSDRDLLEELCIPSVSALPEHAADVRRNATWLAERMQRLGMRTQIVDVPGGRHPVLRADLEVDPSRPTLTVYGHYDVQPPEPLELWESPPFEPVVRDGLVFARGSSDNKGNHMAALEALEYSRMAGGPPLNIRFLIEGEEEISGTALGTYLRQHAEELHTDYVLVWDGGFTEEEEPALHTGLRGILYVELEAKGADHDLHSGTFGGVAPNPLNTLARVIAELKGRSGHVTIPGFYDHVRPPSAEELRSWDRPPEYGETLRRLMGASALEGEAEFPPIQRMWSRPTLDAHGFLSGFVGEGEKTVIPARAMAKVSMRLVPDQDPDAIAERLVPYVRSLSTPGVEVEVRVLGTCRPFLCGADHRAATVAREAFRAAFGKETRLVRSGGSIPVAIDFQEALGAQMVVSGLAQADSRPHSPNERFSLDHYHRGIEMLIRFMYGLA